jgi:hypothetical protein
MKISITLERGKLTPMDTEEFKERKKKMQQLSATEFPVGLLCTKDGDTSGKATFVGTVDDFTKAVKIKKEFLETEQTAQDKKKMNAKLMPIYKKHKAELEKDD